MTVDPPTPTEPGAPGTDPWRWWRRWVPVVAAGELVGFGVPAGLAALTQDATSAAQVPLVIAGGVVEGALLGLSQALVLRRVWPGFRTSAWVVATAVAAGFAWLLGMLPSTTYAVWSGWPVGLAIAAGIPLGVLLLLSIGAAQGWVLPVDPAGARAWVVWTTAGWCAGLAAFSLVAPPLWHPGQSPGAIVLVGLLGGAVMAVVMAAVTGVGLVRLLRSVLPSGPVDPGEGHRMLSSLLGTSVPTATGRHFRVRDLLVDFADGLDRVPVTGVVVGGGHGAHVVPWRALVHPDAASEEVASATSPTQVLLRRDVLDSPVVLADPPRRGRVSDVVLTVEGGQAWVTGLDIGTGGVLRRLVGRSAAPRRTQLVRLSEVHLLSPAAHAAHLAAPGALVHGLPPDALAEVLTRVPVAHARDILEATDRGVVEPALRVLHPHVRGRLVGTGPAPRRLRRFAGWVVHHPARAARTGHR